MKAWLAILFLSGYVSVQRWRMYWEVGSESTNQLVTNSMSRNRFEKIKKYAHYADNTKLDKADKFAKLRPFFNKLNIAYLSLIQQHLQKDLSIAEAMATYYGRHSAKQYIQNKPIKYGYKFWCLCDLLGYLIQFEPYQGKQSLSTTLGVGASVVLRLISPLPPLSFHLFGDRFFSSLKIVDILTEKGIGYTGTVKSNRLEKCPLKNAKDLSKMERGSFDHQHDSSSGILAMSYNDNKVFSVISNVYGILQMTSSKRWSSAESRKISIPTPDCVAKYNKNMGGVDRMDENISNYRISIRSRK